jgi:hypothetical protein
MTKATSSGIISFRAKMTEGQARLQSVRNFGVGG